MPDRKSEPQLNIGLLLCDDVPEDGRARFGNYHGMFQRGLDAVDGGIRLVPYNAYLGELPDTPQSHDGYLISGSGASVFEDKQWIRDLMQFVREVDEANIVVVGICFGHQLIAHALGGRTHRSDRGWGFGIHSTRLERVPAWMRAGVPDYRLVVIHQDQVEDLPAGFDAIASNDFCPNSMITNGRNMLGIQGHPEFSKDYCEYRARFRRETIGEAKLAETLASLSANETDSSVVLGWVSDFLRRAPAATASV